MLPWRCAASDVDLEVARGEFFSIVVPSGCGKSTLLHIVSGVIGATEGRVTFEGR
jgi:NitT/TauT family transport system ATP-binding protein